jgi:ribonuclease J
MTLSVTVHRGTQQIGGSCIELCDSDSGARLILDAGRPLDAPEGASDLLPASLERGGEAAVLISHPHQDHWGLVEELPDHWAIWTGLKAAELIRLSGEIIGRPLQRTFNTWSSRSGPFRVGAFSVTPLLTDHSAFDSYMLLIEASGKRVLYTGDFRRHGRKASLVDRMMEAPPQGVDVLITEGTNLGSNKPSRTEELLEADFVELFNRTSGRVFVCWSGQNIDRTVTIYRAARKAGRRLVIDLYTADVLDRIAEGTGLPRAGFNGLKVVITSGLAWRYEQNGRAEFVSRMAKQGLSAKKLATGRDVIMLRSGLMKDYERAGVTPTSADAFNFSMWSGYLNDPKHSAPRDWFASAGAEIAQIHTSGHASPADLRAFAASVSAKAVVPVHGFNWDSETEGFENLQRLSDGEVYAVP